MAYSLDMFVCPDSISQSIICGICHEIPQEPKQCKIGHIFCEGCIYQWLGKKKICPMDREYLSLKTLSNCLVAKVKINPLGNCNNIFFL